MVRYLRFADLEERGITNSRPALKYRIENFGFPPGRLIGPNTRAWTEAEVEEYLAKCQTAPKATPEPSPTALPRRRQAVPAVTPPEAPPAPPPTAAARRKRQLPKAE